MIYNVLLYLLNKFKFSFIKRVNIMIKIGKIIY